MFGRTAGMFSVGADAGVGGGCAPWVFAPSPRMGLKAFPEGGGTAVRESPGAAFLSRWSIHRTPPPADGTGHCPPRVHFSPRGGEHCQLEAGRSLLSALLSCSCSPGSRRWMASARPGPVFSCEPGSAKGVWAALGLTQREPAWAPAHRTAHLGEAVRPPRARLGSSSVHLDWGAQ